MENKNRGLFTLSGITGMLIATVLLLSILGSLTYLGILAQQDVAQKPYEIPNPSQIKMFSKDNANQKVIKE